MTKNKVLFWIMIALASVALALGLCYAFLGTKSIKETPSFVKVESIDGDYFVTTEFHQTHKYRFKLEQLIGGEYIVVSTVDSDKNSVNLAGQDLDILAGGTYRFSACYFEGNKTGNFSENVNFRPSWALDSIDFDSINFADETLTWKEVYLAESYEIRLVDFDGNVLTRETQTNSLNCEEVPAGEYDVFIIAKASNESLLNSNAPIGKRIRLERTNKILAFSFENGYSATCTQEVTDFEIYVNGQLKGLLKANAIEENEGNFVVSFESSNFVLDAIDFENDVVKLKSMALDCVKESELFQIP